VDRNRDLHVATSSCSGVPGVQAQTHAFYRLLDDLRSRHPALEIESCSSGGARVDLGVLARTDRVWASDCNDAIEHPALDDAAPASRARRSHVGPPLSHTTGRDLDLSFPCATALFGHAGLG
jgi:alpha-galactosidase